MRKRKTTDLDKATKFEHYATHMRGLDFYNPDLHDQPKVTIIGVGGIGSWAALALAKMGIRNIVLMDHDKVEPQNIGCQNYRKEDVGKTKVLATSEALVGIATNLDARHCKFSPNMKLGGIVIACVDNMEARNDIFIAAKGTEYFIDCRIGGELIRMFCTGPSKEPRNNFRCSLYPEDRTTNEPCTGQNIVYVGFHAAAMITKAVQYFIRNGIGIYQEISFDIVNHMFETCREPLITSEGGEDDI